MGNGYLFLQFVYFVERIQLIKNNLLILFSAITAWHLSDWAIMYYRILNDTSRLMLVIAQPSGNI